MREEDFLKLLASCISLMLLVTYVPAQTPEPAYKRYTSTEGLPSSEVYYCLQDSENQIWFATDRGLSKFDGSELTTYTTQDGLTDNVVFELFEDHRKRIWILPRNGRLCYIEDGKIIEYAYNHLLKENIQLESYWYSFYVDASDKIYYGSKQQGLVTISATGELEIITGKNVGTHLTYHEVEKQLLTYGLLKYGKKQPYDWGHRALQEQKINYYYQGHPILNIRKPRRSKAYYHDQGLVCSTQWSIHLVIDQKEVDKVTFENDVVSFKQIGEYFTVGLFGGGLYLYKVIDQKLVLQYHLLQEYTCSDVIQDNSGAFWITTTQGGVFYTPNLDILSYDRSNGLLHNYVYKLGREDNELLIAYTDATQKLGETFAPLKPLTLSASPAINLHDSVLFNRKGCLLRIRDIAFYDLCKQTQVFKSDEEATLRATKYQDVIFLLNNTQLYQYIPDADTINTVDLHYPFSLIEDIEVIEKDAIWLGTREGLYYHTPDGLQSFADRDTALSYRVVSLGRTEEYGLVVATRGAGVVLLKGDDLRVINTSNGLSTNDLTSVFIDSTQNIWVASNRGLHQIDACDPQQVEYYSTDEGLISNEITDVNQIGDQIYIGTKKGLSILNLKTYQKDTSLVEIKLLNTQLNGKEHRAKDSLISLLSGQHTLDLRYVGVNYRALGNIEYRYRIKEAEDTPWLYTKEQKLSIPLPLAKGNYTVELMARILPHEKWSPTQEILKLNIETPFYQTTAFYGLLGLLSLSLVYLGYRYKVWTYPKHVQQEIYQRILKRLGQKTFIVIKVNKAEVRIDEANILFVQSFKDYVEINTIDKKYLYRSTLKDMERKMSPVNFIRIHRSYIVAKNRIDSISNNQLKIEGREIPIGKTYRPILKELKDQFSVLNS